MLAARAAEARIALATSATRRSVRSAAAGILTVRLNAPTLAQWQRHAATSHAYVALSIVRSSCDSLPDN